MKYKRLLNKKKIYHKRMIKNDLFVSISEYNKTSEENKSAEVLLLYYFLGFKYFLVKYQPMVPQMIPKTAPVKTSLG